MEIDEPASASGSEADIQPSWPTRYGRPPWWVTAEDRDQQAVKADEAATARDEAAADRDTQASDRDHAADARERDAESAIVRAQRRLIRGDVEDAQRWAAGIAAVEAAQKAHNIGGTAETAAALNQAEAVLEEQIADLVRASMERREVREDLDNAVQHVAAAAVDRRAATTDRSSSAGDRSASSGDRGAARTAREQAAIDRARDPDTFND